MTFEDLLARDGKLVYKTRGRSMEPMLRQDRDLVILEPLKEKLKQHDIALYRRGKDYVLHRVIQAGGNNYLFRGDKELLKIYLCKIPCQELASMLLLSRDYNYFEG